MCVLQVLGSDSGRRDRPIRTGRRDKPIIHLPSIALRVAIIIGIAGVLFGVVLFRLWFLQILSGQEFVAQANDNRLRSVKVVAPRGAIVDRHGKVIVDNRAGISVGLRLMDVPTGALDGEIRIAGDDLGERAHREDQALFEHHGGVVEGAEGISSVGARGIAGDEAGRGEEASPLGGRGRLRHGVRVSSSPGGGPRWRRRSRPG